MYIGERQQAIDRQLKDGLAPKIAEAFYRHMNSQEKEGERAKLYEQVGYQNILLAGPGGSDVFHGFLSAKAFFQSYVAGIKSRLHGLTSQRAGDTYDRFRLEPIHELQVAARRLSFRVMTAHISTQQAFSNIKVNQSEAVAMITRNSSTTREGLDMTRDDKGNPLALNRATRLMLKIDARVDDLQTKGVPVNVIHVSLSAGQLQGVDLARKVLGQNNESPRKLTVRETVLKRLRI